MELGKDKYRLLIENLSDGFAYHQIIADGAGNPIDYVFLDVNTPFEGMTGLTREKVIGNRVTAVIPGIEASAFDWIGTYGKVALTGERVTFESYSEPLQRWYKVTAYSDAPGFFVTLFHDITDRKEREQMEEALEKTLNNFNALLANSPALISILNKDGRYIEVSDSVARIIGLPADAIKGKTFTDLLPSTVASEFMQTVDRLLEKQHSITKTDIIQVDGEARLFESLLFPIEQKGTDIELIGSIAQDITERKQAEEALRKSEEKLKAAFESTQDAITIFTEEGKFLDCNQRALALFRLAEKEEFFYTRPADLSPLHQPDGRNSSEASRDNISKVLKTGAHMCFEWLHRRKDGNTFPAEVTLTSYELGAKKVLQANIRDNSTQKKAQADLAAERNLLNVVLNSMTDGLIAVDMDGNIILFNNMAGVITGFAPEEAAGKSLAQVFSIVNITYQSIINNPVETIMATDWTKTTLAPTMIVTGDGSNKIITASAAATTDDAGKVMGHVIVFKDITEHKKAEAQLALSQKLESIGQLAAGIAHEINTPLQYIEANARFLQDAFIDIFTLLESYRKLKTTLQTNKNPVELAHNLQNLEDNLGVDYLMAEVPQAIEQSLEGIERVQDIVLAMRNFAHTGSKEKKNVDLNKTITSTVTISRNEWKHIADLETDLAKDLPLVYCSPEEINQVLLNIIINAAHAIGEMVEKGLITKGKIEVSANSINDYVVIIISDNGAGIPSSIINKVFDPFFTTKDVGKGTGQGLAISYDIVVNKHGGKIEVESEEGKGTIFKVLLPLSSVE